MMGAEKSWRPVQSWHIFDTEDTIDYARLQQEIDNASTVERQNHIFDEVFDQPKVVRHEELEMIGSTNNG